MSHSATPRVDWVDYAKGICIVMVVMMHSTLGVEKAAGVEGFMHHVVEFAKPFRMPDFFLISGLFLARVIDRDWRTYLDRKVVHFAYFYVLWLAIQGGFKWPGIALADGPRAMVEAIALSLIEPFGTLWFIYLLPIFFVTAKLLRGVPPFLVLPLAAVLQTLNIATGWVVIDEFASRWIYFLAGWYFAPLVFSLAAWFADRPGLTVAAVVAWACAEMWVVSIGHAEAPGLSLVLGFAGAGAVIATATVLARFRTGAILRYAGEHSIVIYLAFFLPMAVARVVLLKTGLIEDVGTIALLVTGIAVIVPLILYRLVDGTRLGFLFERPAAFRLERRQVMQAAE